MDSFRVRILAELGALPPERLLRALPEDLPAAWLDGSDGSGPAWLLWGPDRELSGRLAAAAGAPEDPARRVAGALEGEHWDSDDPGGALPGWVGWFGYDCGHAYEHYPWLPREPLGFPDYAWARYRGGVAWDASGQARLLWAEPLDGRDHAPERARLHAELRRLVAAPAPAGSGVLAQLPQPVQGADRFRQGVEGLLQRIGAGELYQANLSQRFQGPAPADARALYLRVRRAQPTGYSAYWQDGRGRVLLSWSPECFLSVRGDRVETRPIKGTAARRGDAAADAGARAALEASEKERAELTMIVDMARNDLGRVAVAGGVEVVSAGQVEEYPTLFHRVGHVRARWDARQGMAGLLRATFPPASVTGAPKVAALRAIAALEGEARGPYCGALGRWLPGEQPQAEFSVLIRSAWLTRGHLSFRAGAGIVWDSDPEREWQETLLKARFLQAGLAPDPVPA